MNLPLALLLVGAALVALSVAPALKARRRPDPQPTALEPSVLPAPALSVEPPKPAPPHPSPEDVGTLLDDLLGTGLAQPAADTSALEPPAIEDPRRVAEVLRIWLRDR